VRVSGGGFPVEAFRWRPSQITCPPGRNPFPSSSSSRLSGQLAARASEAPRRAPREHDDGGGGAKERRRSCAQRDSRPPQSREKGVYPSRR
jgi:hypothetical protein